MLNIKNLTIGFRSSNGTTFTAVNGISFSVNEGNIVAIVGESGSGKSLTALSILRLLPKEAIVEGKIVLLADNESKSIFSLDNKSMQSIRGNEVAMIFQEPMTSLNPAYTCGNQVMEAIIRHKKMGKKQAKAEAIELFRQVKLPNPEKMFERYPHQISGGQKQRVMIAMAISCNPRLLIADEPTTALDVRVQKSIMELISELQRKHNISVLLITHDLSLVGDYADDVIVMYKGHIVEQGKAKDVLTNPQHNYTKALLACKPAEDSKGKRLKVLDDFLNAEKPQPAAIAEPLQIENRNNDIVLAVQNLSVKFPSAKNIFGKPTSFFTAVDDVSFAVAKNETVGLVGESGCGKTTLGRAILQLVKPTSGKILLNGNDIALASKEELRLIRRDLQIVFQDPYGSLNPRITIGEAIEEPLHVHNIYEHKKQRREAVVEMLEQVGLSADSTKRYPHQFSGGQRQRICIARALALNPSFLIFDESVSALDVSVQAQVLNLINDLKKNFQFTSIFISHDLGVVHYISDRIMVMHNGKIVEEGSADEVFKNPKNEYTQSLIEAIPGRRILY